NGVTAFFQLQRALKGNDLPKIVLSIDRVFDLYHNNGFMLDKTEFSILDSSDLNARFEAKSIFEYIDKCSDKVKKMAYANMNYLHKPNAAIVRKVLNNSGFIIMEMKV